MKNKYIQNASIILGIVFSIGFVSCEKESITRVTEQESFTDQNECDVSEQLDLNVEGTWIWESTETSSGLITAADVELSKSIYFKEDMVYYYQDNKITASKGYQLFNGVSNLGDPAVVLVFDNDDTTYEVRIIEQNILRIESHNCSNPEVKTYRRK